MKFFACSFPGCTYLAVSDAVSDVPLGEGADEYYCLAHWKLVLARDQVQKRQRGDWNYTQHTADMVAHGNAQVEMWLILFELCTDMSGKWNL